jgi:hypothetical protein
MEIRVQASRLKWFFLPASHLEEKGCLPALAALYLPGKGRRMTSGSIWRQMSLSFTLLYLISYMLFSITKSQVYLTDLS